MRKAWIIVISATIVGGVFAFEYWTSIQFPLVDYTPGDLPVLPVGIVREYDYVIEGEMAGTYRFWVEATGPYAVGAGGSLPVRTAYFARSLTSLEHEGVAAEIEMIYVFGTDLTPFEYRLNASLGDESERITCVFDGWNVEGKIEAGESTLEQSLELPEDTALFDTFMPGHWDLFFKQFTLEPGRRVTIDAFIPQLLSHLSIVLASDKKAKTVSIGGVDYECLVVRVVELNLVLYLHEGDLIRLEEPDRGIVISLRETPP